MGEMADFEFDRMLDMCAEAESNFESDLNYLKREKERREKRPNEAPEDFVWITKDGTAIEVGKMSDSHLNNTIRFVQRRIKEIQESIIWG